MTITKHETVGDYWEQMKVMCRLFVCVLPQELARRFTPQTRHPGSQRWLVDVALLMILDDGKTAIQSEQLSTGFNDKA